MNAALAKVSGTSTAGSRPINAGIVYGVREPTFEAREPGDLP